MKLTFLGKILSAGYKTIQQFPFPDKEVAPSQTSPGFYVSAVEVFKKTLWKKAISPFPTVFYPFGNISAIFIKNEIVVYIVFQFGRV